MCLDRLFLPFDSGYDNGDGVEQNSELAIKWYRQAAKQGHEKAQQKIRGLSCNGTWSASPISRHKTRNSVSESTTINFQSAKTLIRAEGIKSQADFHEWIRSERRPKNFPIMPNRAYQSEWKNWSDFFGLH